MDAVSSTTTPTIMKFGNDVVVPEPSSTNTKNYTVLDSDMAKNDYLGKQTFLDTEQQNIIRQSLVNKENNAIDGQNKQDSQALNSNTDSLKKATDGLNGTQSSSGTTASGNSYNTTGDPYTDQLAGQNADMTAMYAATKDKLVTASTAAGLSESQKSQLQSLTANWDSLIQTQQQANNFYQGGVTTESVRNGTSRYAGGIAMGDVKNAVDQGLAKISDLNVKKQDALNKMQEGFISDNVEAVNSAYKDFMDYTKTVNSNIKEMHQAVLDAHTAALNDQKFVLDVQKQQQQDQQDSRDFAYKNNIVSQAYQIGNSVYDTATGQQIDPGQVDPSQVQVIDPNSKAGQDYVASLSKKYPDSVFPTMTPDQAQQALKYSKIYREETRPPQYVTNPSGAGNFKFDSGSTSRLLSVGLTNSEIGAIQTNLNNGASIDDILNASQLSDEQKKSVKNTMSGVTALQESKEGGKFINEDYIKKYFSPEELKQAAIASGYHGSVRTGNATDEDVQKYVSGITAKVKTLQESNMSDQDIWKQLFGG